MRKTIKITAALCSFAAIMIITYISVLSLLIPENYFVTKGNQLDLNSWLMQSAVTVEGKASDVSIGDDRTDDYTVDLRLMGVLPVKKINVDVVEPIMVVPSGETFGVKMFTDGVLVIGMDSISTENGDVNPAKSAGLEIGDIIESINSQKVCSNEEVADAVKSNCGEDITLKIRRKNMSFDVQLHPVKCKTDGSYKVGLWVRDSSAGIGTMTFYLPEENIFAGLGHGIYDVDTKEMLPLMSGEIVGVNVDNIVKGTSGVPGELRGTFDDESLGSIFENEETGIFGCLSKDITDEDAIPMAMKQDITEGKAQIICSVDNTKKYYDIEIEKIYLNSSSNTKNMVIRIDDEELLSSCGGIVQGMSGSPIIQNGHLVGAVTHVFVNDPTRGYAIFAENMISTIYDLEDDIHDRAA